MRRGKGHKMSSFKKSSTNIVSIQLKLEEKVYSPLLHGYHTAYFPTRVCFSSFYSEERNIVLLLRSDQILRIHLNMQATLHFSMFCSQKVLKDMRYNIMWKY